MKQALPVSWLCLAMIFAYLVTDAHAAEQRLSAVGTLTCTSMPSAARAAADTPLQCSFKGTHGVKLQYHGSLLRKGIAGVPPGKRVFVWSVLSKRRVSSGTDLVGRYLGRAGANSAGILSQKRDASVILKPPVNSSQLGKNSGVSVLELNLRPIRT